MVFGLGPTELLLILGIVIFIYGGKRLAQVGKALGESVTEFKKGYQVEKPEVRDAQYHQLSEHVEPSEPPDSKGV